jgi:hypothetical protein
MHFYFTKGKNISKENFIILMVINYNIKLYKILLKSSLK